MDTAATIDGLRDTALAKAVLILSRQEYFSLETYHDGRFGALKYNERENPLIEFYMP